MFAVTGTGFSAARRITNEGKVRSPRLSLSLARAHTLTHSLTFVAKQPTRHTLDTWEENMMERDRRLTGTLRGQSVRPPPFPSLPFPSLFPSYAYSRVDDRKQTKPAADS